MTVVAEILKAKPDATVQTIAPDASVLEALRTMADKHIGYRSQSFLTVPMKNHENEIIGVLQLINALHPESGCVVEFLSGSRSVEYGCWRSVIRRLYGVIGSHSLLGGLYNP